MNELLLKDSFLLLGNWVILSLLGGILVGVVLVIYRYANPNVSAKLRYQTALLSLSTLLLFTFSLNFLLPDISEIFSKNSDLAVTEVNAVDSQLMNQLFKGGSSEATIQNSEVHDKSSYATIVQMTLGIFWLVGVLIYSIKFLGGFIYLKLLVKNASAVIPQHWQDKALEMKNQLKIGNKVQLMISKKVNSPLTFGFLKPVIIFPLGFFTTLPPEQIEAIILHELYHIKHRDYLFNIGVMLTEIIFFYHPLMWYLSKEIQAERENNCDDAVISQIQNPLNYAKALINVEEFRQRQSNLSLHFSPKSSQLNHRVMRLFSKKASKSTNLKPFLGLVCLTFFLMSFTVLRWDKISPDKPKNSINKEKVHFKIMKDKDGFMLVIAENAIYTQAKNEVHTIWLDDVQLPLNSFHQVKYNALKGMVGTDSGKEYRIYSQKYLSEANKILIAEKKNDVIYRFHTNGGKYHTSEINTWKDKNHPVKQKSNKENTADKASKFGLYTIYGPVEIATKDDSNNTNLKRSKLDRINNLSIITDKKISEFNLMKAESIFSQDTARLGTSKKNSSVFKNDSVLIVLNDEVLGLGSSKLSELSPNMIKSLNVLKGASAIDKYGEQAASGVIEVTTKEAFTEEDMQFLVNSFGKDKSKEFSIDSLNVENAPLFFIDGVPTQKSYLKKLHPNDIKKIDVLKGDTAIEKYGKKAKNGVVEIYTKKGGE